jgi:hypothetical protein
MTRLEDLPPDRVAEVVAKAVADSVARGGDSESIVARALSGVKEELGLGGARPAPPAVVAPRNATAKPFRPAPMGSGKSVGARNSSGRPLVTESDVLAALENGQRELRLAPGTIVTALARDTARDGGLRLVEG